MEDYGSGTINPKVVHLKLTCICKSGVRDTSSINNKTVTSSFDRVNGINRLSSLHFTWQSSSLKHLLPYRLTRSILYLLTREKFFAEVGLHIVESIGVPIKCP